MDYPLQGAVARLLSQRSTISFQAWSLWNNARLQILPIIAFPGSPDKLCRRCFIENEITIHIVNTCSHMFRRMTKIHNKLQAIVTIH